MGRKKRVTIYDIARTDGRHRRHGVTRDQWQARHLEGDAGARDRAS